MISSAPRNCQKGRYINKPPLFRSAMAMNPVRIIPAKSLDPAREANYLLICHDRRVRVVVTSKHAVVRKWVKSTYREHHLFRGGRLVVGLGVQWAPGGDDGAATIQLCVDHNCLIFQLRHAAKSPAALSKFLFDRRISFVGIGNSRDAAMLSKSRHLLQVRQLVDLRCLLPRSLRNSPVEKLASKILGWDGIAMKEWVVRSDWDDEWLSEEQVKYASVDAFLCCLMGTKLKAWLYPAV